MTSGPAAADEVALDDREAAAVVVAAADELAPDDREAAAVVVAVDLLSSLPHAANATRLTARRAPIAMMLRNRRIRGMNFAPLLSPSMFDAGCT